MGLFSLQNYKGNIMTNETTVGSPAIDGVGANYLSAAFCTVFKEHFRAKMQLHADRVIEELLAEGLSSLEIKASKTGGVIISIQIEGERV